MYDARYAEEQEAKYHAALSQMKPAGLVLDVGCGTGLFFSHVSMNAAKIVGVDISKKLLQAKDRAKTLDNVSLVQADADHLPFVDELFDAAFAFTVLQNMPKPSETLGEICRVTRKGAVVVVSALKKVFSKDMFEQLLLQGGLKTLSIEDEANLNCYVASSLKRGSD
jgi:ubiquinone/menaquinone biosynthesis C-methylase UbiE